MVPLLCFHQTFIRRKNIPWIRNERTRCLHRKYFDSSQDVFKQREHLFIAFICIVLRVSWQITKAQDYWTIYVLSQYDGKLLSRYRIWEYIEVTVDPQLVGVSCFDDAAITVARRAQVTFTIAITRYRECQARTRVSWHDAGELSRGQNAFR